LALHLYQPAKLSLDLTENPPAQTESASSQKHTESQSSTTSTISSAIVTKSRKCENWLLTFREWSLPRSEAPESYHLWAGLFTMASVLKRRVKVPKKILGGWEVSPTLFIIFVAPPGRARKSTTANYSEELLSAIPTTERVATSITKEQLLKKLSEVDDSSLSIFSSEFAMFIQKSGHDMYDVLTHLFDANRDVSVETLGRGLDFAEKPCVNLLACTTPDWISNNMPEHVIGGGFASRVIFVFEEDVRRHQMYYDRLGIDWDKVLEMREDLIHDLMHMAVNVQGDFEIDDEVRAFMDGNGGWYQNVNNQKTAAGDNYRLQGYFERKPAHVHKLAMLLHLAYDDELVLTLPDIQGAIAILDDLELKMPRTFANIGRNPYAVDMNRMLDFVKKRGTVSKRDLKANFYQSADPVKLEQLIQGLIDMGKVRLFIDEDDPHNQAKSRLVYNGKP